MYIRYSSRLRPVKNPFPSSLRKERLLPPQPQASVASLTVAVLRYSLLTARVSRNTSVCMSAEQEQSRRTRRTVVTPTGRRALLLLALLTSAASQPYLSDDFESDDVPFFVPRTKAPSHLPTLALTLRMDGDIGDAVSITPSNSSMGPLDVYLILFFVLLSVGLCFACVSLVVYEVYIKSPMSKMELLEFDDNEV